MAEVRVRPVQVRIVPSSDAISCEIRIPRVNLESVMLDPEGVAAEAARVWAQHIREYYNLPPASGAPLVLPGAGMNPQADQLAGERN